MEEAQIDIVDLGASLQRELDTLWGNVNEAENFTIFRTPHRISQSNKNLFEPSVISIGPFHHGQKHLRALEEQKRRFLRDFLSREDNINLDLCISEMKLLEMRTRRCYSETFDDLDSDKFVEMMLLDGCFLIEYFSKKMENNRKSILEVGWNRHFIKSDLLLQENQIPFFIVEKLYELIGYNQAARMAFVKYLACNLLPSDSIIPDSTAEIPDPPDEIHHLVHLCYHYLVPNPDEAVVLRPKPIDLTIMFSALVCCIGFLHWFQSRLVRRRRSPSSTSQSLSVALPNYTRNLSSMVIPSATELKQKGLKFTPKGNPKHMLDISFEFGFLKIPTIKISDDTKPIFANLLAFEQTKYGKEKSPFTRFVVFLANLVKTLNDVTILQECRIIENCLGSEEEFAHFLNQVTEGNCSGEDHYLAQLNWEVNIYIGASWNRQRAKLIRDYFRGRWKGISIATAFIILVLTCVQSFFAVYAYFIPPSS